MNEYKQSFSVSFEYPVCFGHDMFSPDNPLLAQTIRRREPDRRHRLQVFVDSGVADSTPGLNERIIRYFEAHSRDLDLVSSPGLVPGGEEAKNSRSAAETVMESIADNHLCRQSYVVVIGGGSVLDIVGLAASLVHRGVRVLRMPTTVLSQGDSGVGVKTGIDAYGMKNFAGTFAPPDAVLVDFDFLQTLPWHYWIGGISESFKVAMIRDVGFFEFLCKNAERLGNRDEQVVEEVVERSALLHLEHIRTAGDPFEFGKARPLDFGHWSAHRLEVLSGYEIGHGQAVGIGIALDSYYAWKTGLIDKGEFEAVITAFEDCGLPIWAGLLDRRGSDGKREILRGLEEFREHLGGELTVTLPAPIGSGTEVHSVNEAIVEEGIEFLGERARGRQDADRT